YVQERGLPGAVRTEQSVDLATASGERDPIEGTQFPEALRDVAGVERRGSLIAHGGNHVTTVPQETSIMTPFRRALAVALLLIAAAAATRKPHDRVSPSHDTPALPPPPPPPAHPP